MHHTTWLGVMGLFALAHLASGEEWRKNFALTGRGELRVDTNDAGVRIRSGDVREIQALVVTEGWRIGPDEVRVTDRQSGNRVEIDVRIPNRMEMFNFRHRSVRVELVVPREIAAQVHTGDGHIGIDGVKGEFRLQTGDGGIDGEGLDGSLEAHTGDGRIAVRGRFDVVDVRTGDGSIEVGAEAGSRMTTGWRVNTSDGSVRLRLPSDFAADLDVHTGDGHIASDLPISVLGTQSESSLRGKINGGGRTLTVRSGDGSIRIERM